MWGDHCRIVGNSFILRSLLHSLGITESSCDMNKTLQHTGTPENNMNPIFTSRNK